MRIPIYRTVEVRDNPGIPMSVPRYRISLVKETEMEWPTKMLQSAGDAYEMAKVIFEGYDRESVYVFMLDQKHTILGINLVSMGSLTESLVHPRELFKAIILVNAAAFVMVHNHPSGDPTPSQADRQLTARIKSVATLMGIRMLDSIVAGDGSYYSFAESGALASLPSDVIKLGEAGEFKWGENPRRRMSRFDATQPLR
jgi:DNA repair protein RadC